MLLKDLPYGHYFLYKNELYLKMNIGVELCFQNQCGKTYYRFSCLNVYRTKSKCCTTTYTMSEDVDVEPVKVKFEIESSKKYSVYLNVVKTDRGTYYEANDSNYCSILVSLTDGSVCHVGDPLKNIEKHVVGQLIGFEIIKI